MNVQVDSSRSYGIKCLSLSSLVPSNIDSVLVISRKENEIALQWNKVNNRDDYEYELKYRNVEGSVITPSPTNSIVEHKVMDLFAGTEYVFMLYTVFENVKSSGYNFSNVTSEYIILVHLQRHVQLI